MCRFCLVFGLDHGKLSCATSANWPCKVEGRSCSTSSCTTQMMHCVAQLWSEHRVISSGVSTGLHSFEVNTGNGSARSLKRVCTFVGMQLDRTPFNVNPLPCAQLEVVGSCQYGGVPPICSHRACWFVPKQRSAADPFVPSMCECLVSFNVRQTMADAGSDGRRRAQSRSVTATHVGWEEQHLQLKNPKSWTCPRGANNVTPVGPKNGVSCANAGPESRSKNAMQSCHRAHLRRSHGSVAAALCRSSTVGFNTATFGCHHIRLFEMFGIAYLFVRLCKLNLTAGYAADSKLGFTLEGIQNANMRVGEQAS
jgi:hypothetical protein